MFFGPLMLGSGPRGTVDLAVGPKMVRIFLGFVVAT